jgi:CheY-like chemotaxis protein
MPERLLLMARWLAVFVLAISIGLIIVRWKFPRKPESSGTAFGYWREVWRQWRRWKARDRQRDLDIRALHGKSVLVIDPDERSSRVLVWRLQGLGCRVIKARTATRGLELAASEKLDVIIADALLPDMSAGDIHAAAGAVGLPVVFVGAVKGQRRELAALGDNVVSLGKPFDPDEATAAAGRLLRRHSSART